jgi:hypothetical protein
MTEGGAKSTIDVLTQRNEAILLLCQLSQSVMGRVGFRFQRHMASVTVKLPNQPWVAVECFRGSQLSRIVCAPESACTPKGREPGRG